MLDAPPHLLMHSWVHGIALEYIQHSGIVLVNCNQYSFSSAAQRALVPEESDPISVLGIQALSTSH